MRAVVVNVFGTANYWNHYVSTTILKHEKHIVLYDKVSVESLKTHHLPDCEFYSLDEVIETFDEDIRDALRHDHMALCKVNIPFVFNKYDYLQEAMFIDDDLMIMHPFYELGEYDFIGHKTYRGFKKYDYNGILKVNCEEYINAGIMTAGRTYAKEYEKLFYRLYREWPGFFSTDKFMRNQVRIADEHLQSAAMIKVNYKFEKMQSIIWNHKRVPKVIKRNHHYAGKNKYDFLRDYAAGNLNIQRPKICAYRCFLYEEDNEGRRWYAMSDSFKELTLDIHLAKLFDNTNDYEGFRKHFYWEYYDD